MKTKKGNNFVEGGDEEGGTSYHHILKKIELDVGNNIIIKQDSSPNNLAGVEVEGLVGDEEEDGVEENDEDGEVEEEGEGGKRRREWGRRRK
jgi:hypothetical protein